MKLIKKSTRIRAAVLAATISFATLYPSSASAAVPNTPKEEVVYISLNADGSVREINVVNIFELDEDGRIIDYGSYQSLRNMTTTDPINQTQNQIAIDTKAGKLYYEGKLDSNVIPWSLSVKYFMDGREYSADEIAGMSGKLEIRLSVKQNKACDSSFFEGYALQATIALDTRHASNILSDNATIANVGDQKQLTYTILPNKETDISLTSDVTDFEMDGISINGVRMNLDIDIDDSSLQEQIDDIVSAVNDLDDGADELHDGATELHDATDELNDAVGDLPTGVSDLYSGAKELADGLSTLKSRNKSLTDACYSAYEALCSAAQTQLNAVLSANGLVTVTLTPDTYSEVLMDLLAQMDAEAVYTQTYEAALAEVTAQVEARADELYQEYIKSQEEDLYAQAAREAIIQKMVANGYTQEQAEAYLKTEEGQALTRTTVANMTAAEKEQVLQTALSSLNDDQKKAIREAYIDQMMNSDEVQEQINAAVSTVSEAAAQVAALKGQLDQYDAFYKGLVSYTKGVRNASGGADKLVDGLSTLYDNTDTLKTSVDDLNTATGDLKDGTSELKDGTSEFVEETSDMNTKVSDEIDSMTTSLTGEDVETVSFVSEQNVNIQSVQFVIKTDAVQIEEADADEAPQEETLSFWQKLLRLFHISK